MSSKSINEGKTIALEQVLSSLIQMEGLSELALKFGFIKRQRKLNALELLSALMVCCSSAGVQWLSQIHRAYCGLSRRQISYKPFHNQLRKPELGEFLQSTLSHLMGQGYKSTLCLSPKLKERFKDIQIHDGSSFGLKESLASAFPGRFTTTSPAAVELHCTLSLFGSMPNSVTLAADSESEVRHRPNPESLKDSLLLADRAFEGLDYFKKIQNNDGFYIVRGKKNIKPIVVKAYDQRGRRQRKLEGRTLDLTKLKGQNYDMEVEWTCSKGTILSERFCVLYKRGPKNKKDFTLLHTNLKRSEFRISEIVNLYRYRWQIEIFFKECKSYANLKAFDTNIPEIAESLIWASLCTAVFNRLLAHTLQRIYKVPISTLVLASHAHFFANKLMPTLINKTMSISRKLNIIAELASNIIETCREVKLNKKRTRDLIDLRHTWDIAKGPI